MARGRLGAWLFALSVLAYVPLGAFHTPAEAATVVPAQPITLDTTWNLAGSPYYVLGEVNVSAGATLTIEPGVRVLFDEFALLRVLGNLSAVGTVAAPILFLSNATTPGPNDWEGIRLLQGGRMALENATLHHAFYAVWVIGASGLVLANLSVSESFRGLSVETSANITVRDSQFTNNTGVGIQLYQTSGSRIEGLRLSGNNNGIILRVNSNDNTVTNSTVYSNTGVGIQIAGSFRNRLYGNQILDNSPNGEDDTAGNNWSAPYPVGGNLWGDYTGFDVFGGWNQTVPPPDGFGDTPYAIDNDSADPYPRMNPGAGLPPGITLLSPPNGSALRPGTPVVVRVADQDLDTAEYAVDGGAPVAFVDLVDIATAGWTEGFHNVSVRARDLEGTERTRRWTFRVDATLPEVRLLSPADGSLFRPGAVLSFNVTDALLLEVLASVDGAPPVAVAAPYQVGTAGWADGAHLVQVTGRDTAGNARTASFNFTSDGTAPAILATSPFEGEANVSWDAVITITFSEPMDRFSVADAVFFSLPYRREWRQNDTVLALFLEAPLEPDTGYALEVSETATDRAGNPVPGATTLAFRTSPGPPEPPPPSWLSLEVFLALVMSVELVLVLLFFWNRRRRERPAKGSPPPAKEFPPPPVETPPPEGRSQHQTKKV